MAKPVWDGFSMTFEYHFQPSTLPPLVPISFLWGSCGWCGLVLQSVFEYDSFILKYALFLTIESKARGCFTTSQDRDGLWCKGVQWRGGLCVDCPPSEKHQSRSCFFLTRCTVLIFLHTTEFFNHTYLSVFHQWSLPIPLELWCSVRMEMSNKLFSARLIALLYYFESNVENVNICWGIIFPNTTFLQQVDPKMLTIAPLPQVKSFLYI